jgi:hypothetical protein
MKMIKLLPLLLLFAACKKDKNEAPPPEPIAYYKFDNDYLTNSMSSLLTGSYVGNIASTTDSFNVAYGCVTFNGDGYIKVKDSDLLDFAGNQFTFSLWIRPTKTSVIYLINKAGDNNADNPYSLDIFNGVVRAYIRTNTDEQFLIEGSTPIKAGVWQHIAATFSGTQLTVFYNGKKEGSVAIDRPLVTSKGDLAIGGHIDYFPAGAMYGRIDNVKIFDKVLSDGQVMNLYKHYKD